MPIRLAAERLRACFRDGLILLAHSAADADATDHFSSALQGNSSGEDHDATVVRYMDAEELPARLAQLCQILRCNIECARGERLIYGDVDAAEPRVLHTNEGFEVAPFVDNGDVHWLADVFGLLFSSSNHLFGFSKRHHSVISFLSGRRGRPRVSLQ